MKNRSKLSLVMSIAAFVVALILTLGVKLVFHACVHEDGTIPGCKGSEQIVFIIGIVMSVASLALIIFGNRMVQIIISDIIFVAAIFCTLVPGKIAKLCMMPTMRCRSVMQPAVIACGAVLALICLINSLINFKVKKN